MRARVYGVLFTIVVVVLLMLAFPRLADPLRGASIAPLETRTVSFGTGSAGLATVLMTYALRRQDSHPVLGSPYERSLFYRHRREAVPVA